MGIGNNIRRIRQQYGMTQGQFGSIAGVSATAVSQWENDRTVPRFGVVQRIANYFDIPKSAILDAEVADPLRCLSIAVPKKAVVPLLTLNQVLARDAGDEWESREEVEVLETVLSGHPRAFAFTVQDDCMEHVIPKGCHVLVDPGLEPVQGSIVVVELDIGSVVMRRWQESKSGLLLAPDNYDGHGEIFITLEDGPVRRIGTVVWFQAAGEME